MVINALKSTKYKVEKVGVWYTCASTFISGLKIFLSGRKQKVIINGKTSKTVNSHKWNSSGESECCRTNILLRFYKCTPHGCHCMHKILLMMLKSV